jgi:hypothetical protein
LILSATADARAEFFSEWELGDVKTAGDITPRVFKERNKYANALKLA